jgi:hypothetical protein
MTRTSKEEYIRVHFPHYIKINALFDQYEVKRITEALIYVGLMKKRHRDQNYESVKNMILKMQNKYIKNMAINRLNNKGE